MKAYMVGELLELSIEFEKNAQEVYKKWAGKFASVPDVAAFWRDYSIEESIHARQLEKLRARLSPDQLATLIESELAGDTRRMLAALQNEQEHDIQDLDQAFQYANMIEHSEINPLFEIIMSTFEPDQEAIALLRSQLEKHINRLIYEFPKRFSSSKLRRELKV
jgi:rubrerythrin